jgi:hypothetical protein
MTSTEIRALENAGRTAMVWSDDQIGQVHYGNVLKALTPALLILTIAAGLLVAML